jgi:hypothetical protein
LTWRATNSATICFVVAVDTTRNSPRSVVRQISFSLPI